MNFAWVNTRKQFDKRRERIKGFATALMDYAKSA